MKNRGIDMVWQSKIQGVTSMPWIRLIAILCVLISNALAAFAADDTVGSYLEKLSSKTGRVIIGDYLYGNRIIGNAELAKLDLFLDKGVGSNDEIEKYLNIIGFDVIGISEKVLAVGDNFSVKDDYPLLGSDEAKLRIGMIKKLFKDLGIVDDDGIKIGLASVFDSGKMPKTNGDSVHIKDFYDGGLISSLMLSMNLRFSKSVLKSVSYSLYHMDDDSSKFYWKKVKGLESPRFLIFSGVFCKGIRESTVVLSHGFTMQSPGVCIGNAGGDTVVIGSMDIPLNTPSLNTMSILKDSPPEKMNNEPLGSVGVCLEKKGIKCKYSFDYAFLKDKPLFIIGNNKLSEADILTAIAGIYDVGVVQANNIPEFGRKVYTRQEDSSSVNGILDAFPPELKRMFFKNANKVTIENKNNKASNIGLIDGKFSYNSIRPATSRVYDIQRIISSEIRKKIGDYKESDEVVKLKDAYPIVKKMVSTQMFICMMHAYAEIAKIKYRASTQANGFTTYDFTNIPGEFKVYGQEEHIDGRRQFRIYLLDTSGRDLWYASFWGS